MSDDKKQPASQEQITAIKNQLETVQQLSSLVRRSQLFSGLGKSYEGDRSLYAALGYKYELAYDDFVNIWAREGLGKRVNNAPCDAVWCDPPRVFDADYDDPDSEDPFETEFNELVRALKLWNKFNRVDKLLGFGTYSILLLGFNDVKDAAGFAQEVAAGERQLLYVQCYSAEHASIKDYETDENSPRYGQPKTYQVHLMNRAGRAQSSSVVVHHSRVIHIVEENLENENEGEPRLKNPYNRLKDVQKIVGGSGEMFWRGARPGYVAKLDDEYQDLDLDGADLDSTKATNMRDQLEEFEHDLRRWLYLRGVSVEALQVQISDPSKHFEVQLKDLAASTGIPTRILIGSERGELASTQDLASWNKVIDSRRRWFATPVIIEPFIERLIKYQVLPEAKNLSVQWPDLTTISDESKANTGKARAEALKAYLKNPGGQDILPPDLFLRLMLGLGPEDIDLALSRFDDIQSSIMDEDREQQLMDEDENEEESLDDGGPE